MKKNCVNREISVPNNFNENKEKSIIVEKEKENLSENNSLLIKKRLRNKEIIQKVKTTDISNKYMENEKSQSESISISIDEKKIDLPEFRMDSLAQESKIIKKVRIKK